MEDFYVEPIDNLPLYSRPVFSMMMAGLLSAFAYMLSQPFRFAHYNYA
jgi:hypothetical protein